MSVEQELWNIFTYYTLYGNPLDPEHMNKTYFMKMCKDCQLLTHLAQADIAIMYQSEVKRAARKAGGGSSPAKRDNPSLLTHGDFLNLLLRMAARIYPDGDAEVMFQKLLMEHILPLAPRRQFKDISRSQQNGDVRSLIWSRFGPALRQVCAFYMSLSDLRRRKALAAETRQRNLTKGGVGMIATTSRRHMEDLRASQGQRLAYKDFVQFTQDYRVVCTGLLTTIEVGDAYLCTLQQKYTQQASLSNTTLSPRGGHRSTLTVTSSGGEFMSGLAQALHEAQAQDKDTLISLDEDDFLQVVVRMGLRAYEGLSDISPVDKLKGFLLLLWRHVTKQDASGGGDSRRRADSSKGKAGDLNICGSALFNQVMLDVWREDGYRDYLHKDSAPPQHAKSLIKRMSQTGARSPGASQMLATIDSLGESMGEQSLGRVGSLSPMSSSSDLRQSSAFLHSTSTLTINTVTTRRPASQRFSPSNRSMTSPRSSLRSQGSRSPPGPRRLRITADKVRALLVHKPELANVLHAAMLEMDKTNGTAPITEEEEEEEEEEASKGGQGQTRTAWEDVDKMKEPVLAKGVMPPSRVSGSGVIHVGQATPEKRPSK